MPVTNDQVAQEVHTYLHAHPEEEQSLAPLLDLTRRAAEVTYRRTFPGHITCGVVAVAADRTVLQIHHRTLDRWLLPGGHVEQNDPSLLAAAMRELTEETGIGPTYVTPVLDRPVDIDAHSIPPNPAKGEPDHIHYDFRYLLGVHPLPGAVSIQVEAVSIQVEEVTGFRWAPLTDLSGRLSTRVQAALARHEQRHDDTAATSTRPAGLH